MGSVDVPDEAPTLKRARSLNAPMTLPSPKEKAVAAMRKRKRKRSADTIDDDMSV